MGGGRLILRLIFELHAFMGLFFVHLFRNALGCEIPRGCARSKNLEPCPQDRREMVGLPKTPFIVLDSASLNSSFHRVGDSGTNKGGVQGYVHNQKYVAERFERRFDGDGSCKSGRIQRPMRLPVSCN